MASISFLLSPKCRNQLIGHNHDSSSHAAGVGSVYCVSVNLPPCVLTIMPEILDQGPCARGELVKEVEYAFKLPDDTSITKDGQSKAGKDKVEVVKQKARVWTQEEHKSEGYQHEFDGAAETADTLPILGNCKVTTAELRAAASAGRRQTAAIDDYGKSSDYAKSSETTYEENKALADCYQRHLEEWITSQQSKEGDTDCQQQSENKLATRDNKRSKDSGDSGGSSSRCWISKPCPEGAVSYDQKGSVEFCYKQTLLRATEASSALSTADAAGVVHNNRPSWQAFVLLQSPTTTSSSTVSSTGDIPAVAEQLASSSSTDGSSGISASGNIMSLSAMAPEVASNINNKDDGGSISTDGVFDLRAFEQWKRKAGHGWELKYLNDNSMFCKFVKCPPSKICQSGVCRDHKTDTSANADDAFFLCRWVNCPTATQCYDGRCLPISPNQQQVMS
eukprot:GHVS01058072.1.p1 GENE.GHVS01058072.1~~GHVS01058072.1.p1  ORF type:complete len:449 (+),score=98.15 GHVS01058072.1:147-1493(+)